jgi:GTP-binding protein HflX
LFDRYEAGEQAVLVHIFFSDEQSKEDLHELQMLVSSAGVNAVDVITGSRQTPGPKYFVGSGKAEEIANAVRANGADVVIFNHSLSPSQERNLEQLCKCRVLDRTSLILDIFAQRARTHEGKLQVELAQLKHISTRLVRGWTHLERQKGGIGLRGPVTQRAHQKHFKTSTEGAKTAGAGTSFPGTRRITNGVFGGVHQCWQVHII